MPAAGKAWYHLILNARGSWLTGDPRGFRTRQHRIHSSGDYKNPPPDGEHAGLLRRVQALAAAAVTFPPKARPRLGEAIVRKATAMRLRALAVSVDAHHAHVLIECGNSRDEAMRVMGSLKQYASQQVGDTLPGRIWAGGGDPIRVRDLQHHRNVYRYILDHQHKGAWVWSFRGGTAVSGGGRGDAG